MRQECPEFGYIAACFAAASEESFCVMSFSRVFAFLRRFHIPTVLAFALIPTLPAETGKRANLPIEVALRQDLGGAECLMISGGVVGRGYAPSDVTGVLPGGDDSATVTLDQPAFAKVFETAHFEATLALLDEVTTALRTPPAAAPPDWTPPILSGNLAGGLHYGRWPEAAARFDCLNNELNVAALDQELSHFLGTAAISEASGTTFLVMPSASSNRAWSQSEDPVAYARGTGLTYALGGHMHIPWCLYDGTQFARYYGTPSLHQPIFRMIHENQDRFDGYVPALWHLMEIPYGDRGVGDLKSLEAALRVAFDAGIPVALRFRTSPADAGAEGSRFGPDRFMGEPVFTHVLSKEDRADFGAGPFHLIDGFDGAYLPPMPRVSANASTFPLVIHLMRGFDEKSALSAQFEISGEWLPASRIKDISIVSVAWDDQPDAGIRWEPTPDGNTLVEVKNIPAWGVIRVETDEPLRLPGIERSRFREQMAESEIPIMRMIRFNDQWKRPAWVDEALASGTDPLDGYHITRITWSYDAGGSEMEYARKRGWGFHGSIGLLHSHMGAPSDLTGGDMITRPPAWKGWALYPDGQAMLIRPDWNPPRYGASFAASEYRDAVMERARMWMDLGVTGIQFDDVMGMLNRVWQYGGDFSDAMMEDFKSGLIAGGFPDVTDTTPLNELRQRVVLASQWENPARIVNASPPGTVPTGWVAIPYQATSIAYPGEIWIGPKAFARPDTPFVVEYDVRFSDGDGPWAELILADGDRTIYLSRFRITPEMHADVIPTGQWLRIRLRYDPVACTMRHAIGVDAQWSDPVAFETPLVNGNSQSFAVLVMANPLASGIDVRSINVFPEPSIAVEMSPKQIP